MTCYKHGIKTMLALSVLVFALSCKTEKPGTKLIVPDSATPVRTTAKKIFYDSFPQPTGFINDYEGLFTSSEKNTLTGLIETFERETTVQIAVVSFDSTMTTANNLEARTLQIAKAWGVGRKDTDNGIVIGISKHFRKIRIENGNGIANILSDAETKRIVEEGFIPLFKQGKYYEGVKTGLLLLMKNLRQKYTA